MNNRPNSQVRGQLTPNDGIPILHGPLTEEEIKLNEEEARKQAERDAEEAYKKRQIDLTQSGVRLTRANLIITWTLAAFTAIGAATGIYQAQIANKSMGASESAANAAKSAADTAAQTLQEMRNGQGAQDTHTLALQTVTQANETKILAQAAKQSADAERSAAEATKSVAETASESLTSVQGAFLAFMGNATAEKVIENNRVTALTLSFPWKNIGSTPTKNFDSRVNWQSFPEANGMPDNFGFSDFPGIPARQIELGRDMGGNATLNIPVAFLDGSRRRIFKTYVWGWATYNDVFKGTPRHLSEFCDELTDVTISTDDATLSSAQFTWKLSLCKVHNCYDNECSDYAERVRQHSRGRDHH